MIGSKKVVVVMPAYNAEKTLKQTYDEIPFDIVDEVILTDDCSKDNTVEEAGRLGIKEVLVHERNKGYGGNQKTCYNRALELGADIVIMLHPDYQYTPKLIASMAYVIANDVYPVVLASRILGKGARKGGMPWIKYVANRILTFIQNVLLNQKLSELKKRFPRIVNQVNNLRDELKELGLMPETTYLYMQGHHVMDNVVMKLLIPVCTALRREREQEIKRLAEHNEQFRNELTCYQNSQVNVEIMLKKNVAYKRLFHYEWLRQDIQEYLAKGE